jgi:MFS family permease
MAQAQEASMSVDTIVETDALARLDTMPWTRFHTTLTIALGVGWALDSFETNIIGSVFGVLKTQWGLSAAQGSLAVSIWVVGMLVGAIGFGYLADRFGRKRLFLATLLWYGVFATGTAFAWNYESFLFFRFMTALAVGGEYSAVTATMGEFFPKAHRGRTDALILSGFPVGAMASAGASWLLFSWFPPEIGWRIGFGLGAVLALFFLWVRRAIPESPRWLLQQGRVAEVEAIVDAIAATAKGSAAFETARRRYPTASFVPTMPSFLRNLGELGTRYRYRCGLASVLNFSQAAIVYGALALMALVILPEMNVPAADLPLYYFWGNAAALLGGVVGAISVEAIGRRPSLVLSYSLTVLAILPLYGFTSLQGMVFSYCLMQFGVTWAYITAYVVAAEILPTRLRATGLGVSVAIGRVGAMLAPLMLTFAYQSTGTPSAALLVLIILALPGPIAALLWWLWGEETRNLSLEEGSADTQDAPRRRSRPVRFPFFAA